MTKRTKKPDVIVPPAPVDHPFLDDAPMVLADDTRPMRIGSAEVVPPAAHPCPICGGAFEGVRCPIDGFQPRDTP